MLPEPVSMSRSTEPLTFKLRWKLPSAAAHAAVADQLIRTTQQTTKLILRSFICPPYSYRKDSIGAISAARCAGYIPAVRVISDRVKKERITEITETIGCGTKSGKGSTANATQIPTPKNNPSPPLTMVRIADSAKNCFIMSRRVGPMGLQIGRAARRE